MNTNETAHSGDGRVCLCGVPIDRVSMREVIDRVHLAILNRTPLTISVVNVAKAVNMRTDSFLRESVCSGDLVLADGMPLVWLSGMKGRPLPERVAGIDLMFEIFKLSDRHGYRLFLLGATEETLQKVVGIARRDYPGMVIAGWRNGYFDDRLQEEVAYGIRDARPDVLLVAMTSPKKELFMKRWSEVMAVPVCHGVGGSFDVMAGVTQRAPGWMQRLGLEWLYRLLQEPGRLWKRYLRTNLVFTRLAPRCIFCTKDCAEELDCPWREWALPVKQNVA